MLEIMAVVYILMFVVIGCAFIYGVVKEKTWASKIAALFFGMWFFAVVFGSYMSGRS